MSGPARSAAHWRSTEEHIMLPTAAPSLFILLFFFFLMQLLLFSCFCFLYKISSKEVWWARTLCFWVECLTPGQSDSNEDSVPRCIFLAFIFALQLFWRHINSHLLRVASSFFSFFSQSAPFFSPSLNYSHLFPCGNAAKAIKSSNHQSCLQYVWTAREKKTPANKLQNKSIIPVPISQCERTERALCRRSETFQILQTVHNRSRLSWRAALRNILLAIISVTAESSYIQTQDSTFVSQVEICTSETTDGKSARYSFTVSVIYQSKI